MERHPPRFFVPAAAIDGVIATLDAAETRHLKARRIAIGEAIVLVDGAGRGWTGELAQMGKSAATVRLLGELPFNDGESSLHLTLAVGVLKGDRFDWLIEKATELGVTRILPFVSRYGITRGSEARLDRWREIARSAVKQCGRSQVPEILAPQDFATLIRAIVLPAFVLWEGATAIERPSADSSFTSVTLIVGPEGGFTTDEIESASAVGINPISFGQRILRAETAAIAAVVWGQSRWGDL